MRAYRCGVERRGGAIKINKDTCYRPTVRVASSGSGGSASGGGGGGQTRRRTTVAATMEAVPQGATQAVASAIDRKLIPLPGGRSEIWKRKLFGFYSDDGKTVSARSRAVCCVCYAEIPYSGNTTNLCIHLAKHHPDIYMTMKAELEEMGKMAPKTPTRNSRPTLIGPTVIRNNPSAQSPSSVPTMMPRTAMRSQQITDSIAEFLARDLQPVNVVEGSGFQQMIHTLDVRYELLGPSHFVDILQTKKQNLSNMLLQRLEETETCALTTDCWTSDGLRNYVTLLVHFVDSVWDVQTFALKTMEITAEQTHVNHIWDLNRVLADWNLMPRIVYHQMAELAAAAADGDASMLDSSVITVEVTQTQMKVIAGVTNDSGNVALGLKHLGMTCLPCFANTLNGAVAAGIGNSSAPLVSELIAKAKRLVSHFSRHTKDKFLLSKKYLDMCHGGSENSPEGTTVELLLDCPGKWTTTAEMIGRLLELREALNTILMNHRERSVRELGLTPEEWYQLEILNSALKAVIVSITILGGDENASCSMVAPLLYRMKEKFMKITEADTPAVFQYKKVVWDQLVPHYNEQDIQSVLNIAAFLDPRFKEQLHLLDTQKEEVLQAVRQMAIEVDEASVLLASSGGITSPATPSGGGTTAGGSGDGNGEPVAKRTRQRLEGLDLLFGNVDAKDAGGSGDEITVNELDKYLQEPAIDIKDSPLQWWKRNWHRFPTIAKLARRYLCIPATAVPSDRILSPEIGAGSSGHRKRLNHDDADLMIFLNRNMDIAV